MSSNRKRATGPSTSDPDDYALKRKRNNEAVNRTRQKKRQEENETAEKVEGLRAENEALEREVESLEKELKFLKEIFVAYAKKNKGSGNSSTVTSGES